MEFGFEIREDQSRNTAPNPTACYRDGEQCVTALGKDVSFKSRKSAEGYISKQVAIRQEESLVSDEERAALKAEVAKKEAEEKAARDDAYDARLRHEREEKEARRSRAILNSTLKIRGYKWVNVGFKSEEDADAFSPNLSIGDDWQLFNPEGKAVSLSAAKAEIGWQYEQ